MEEIKGRAWLRDEKRWLKPHEIERRVIVNPENAHTGKFEINEHCGRNVYNLGTGVDVMWFTGLHDRNGKEIYEGDRVRLNGDEYYSNESLALDDLWEFIGTVEFNSCMWLVADTQWIPFCDILSEDISVEVIGNIYENEISEK